LGGFGARLKQDGSTIQTEKFIYRDIEPLAEQTYFIEVQEFFSPNPSVGAIQTYIEGDGYFSG
jgi:hypothetical protein